MRAAAPGSRAERVHHPVFARVYARLSRAMERDIAERRDALLAGLTGRVIEIGAGNGLNFAHYPATVAHVLAVEPEPYLRVIAAAAARTAEVSIEVVGGTAGQLPAADSAFDAGVASLMLCSVGDQALALAELYRVIRPGGELRFFEHVRADTPGLARVQRLADLAWPTLFGGCHTSRDTLAALAAAGFQVESVTRFRFPASRIPSPAAPHVLGVARRPAAAG
jgi:ubiquinone/menaquinone biosynthesis C-methylase UbiE